MRLSISNIAWRPAEDEIIAGLLNAFGVDAIDVAPGKYFAEFDKTTDAEIANIRSSWSKRGIEIIGMQALLFGTNGMNVFGTLDVQATMLRHLTQVCRIGAGLGAKRLVFGSPKNRNRSGLSDQKAEDTAVCFFQRLGYIADSEGVVICLEPNPACYGANFMTNSQETALIVERVSHPAIRMQFDSGSLFINGEKADDVLGQFSGLIGHVHISEPGLVPIGDCESDHATMHNAIERFLPNHPLTIEMLAPKSEPHEAAVSRALAATIKYYRTSDVEARI